MDFKSKILIKSQNAVGTEIASELSGNLYAVVCRTLTAEKLEESSAVLIDNTSEDMDEYLESLILSGKMGRKTFVLTNDTEPLISDTNGTLFISAKLGTENICRFICHSLNIEAPRKQTEKVVSGLLLSIGFHANLKGYRYIAEAVTLVIENSDFAYCFNKKLYPLIAKKYGVTPENIERAIRTSIEVAYDRNYDKFERFFGYTLQKPTNTEFILFCAEKIRIELL